MAYALGFPRDITEIIMSMRDWRYEQVRAKGGTPRARCVPKLMSLVAMTRKPEESTWTVMKPGKLYMQHIDSNRSGDWIREPGATINIWMGTSKCDWYCHRRVSDGIIVRKFEDVLRASRQFG